MEKLEYKQVIPYLIYGLKVITQNRRVEIKGFEFGKELPFIWVEDRDKPRFKGRCGFGFKPILRPLSDLTKEIEINGKKFVPIEKLGYNHIIPPRTSMVSDLQKRPKLFPYWLLEQLFEWHFDVFGLIKKGLAIDTNTL